MAGDVKFIRVRGRVVPIKNKGPSSAGKKLRKDKGLDLRARGQNKYDRKLVSEVIEKHGRQATKKERFREGVAGGIFGASLGGIAGGLGEMALDVASKGRIKLTGKKALVTAGALGVLGAFAGASGSQKRISNRSYNKHYGKALAKKKKTGSSV